VSALRYIGNGGCANEAKSSYLKKETASESKTVYMLLPFFIHHALDRRESKIVSINETEQIQFI